MDYNQMKGGNRFPDRSPAGEGRGEDQYVKLAREALEAFVVDGAKIDVPDDIPSEMVSLRAGVFVSLKKGGDLRGCIGTIAPTCKSVAEEIIQNAISACSKDPRFDPVTAGELNSINVSVDVLSEAEAISSKEELDVKRYGVIVTKGFRRGLLLPNLDGVDTIDKQLSIALQKAGIFGTADYKMERFEVVRHE